MDHVHSVIKPLLHDMDSHKSSLQFAAATSEMTVPVTHTDTERARVNTSPQHRHAVVHHTVHGTARSLTHILGVVSSAIHKFFLRHILYSLK